MEKQRIIIFAGAGISAESGLATFRETGGLWTQFDVDEVCNYHVFKKAKLDEEKRKHIFDFYNLIKAHILKAQPNNAHKVIASWQEKYGSDRVKIITANIDDLFEKAGAKDVLHVHGEIYNMHCAACSHTWNIGNESFDYQQRCPQCSSRLTKPNVVFFGEMAPNYLIMNQICNMKRRQPNDIILYIGSSMSVIPPERIVQERNEPNTGITVLVNKDSNEQDFWFKNRYYGLATEQIKCVNDEIINQLMLK
jgi:NAD-dependent deacetylase